MSHEYPGAMVKCLFQAWAGHSRNVRHFLSVFVIKLEEKVFKKKLFARSHTYIITGCHRVSSERLSSTAMRCLKGNHMRLVVVPCVCVFIPCIINKQADDDTEPVHCRETANLSQQNKHDHGPK